MDGAENMLDYQIRVVEEKDELDGKIERLAKFKQSEQFVSVPKDEQDRLTQQLAVMREYSSILGERIAAFEQG